MSPTVTMEILLAQVTEARSEIDSLKSRVDFLSEWQSGHAERIADLETEVESVEETPSGEIVVETVPAAVVETAPAETEPKKRKRSFI